MSTDRLHTLLAAAHQQDQQELQVAHGAMVASLKAHGTAPTAATVVNKNATREDFEATLDRMEAKYFPTDQPAPQGERFAHRKQALDWLKAQGYKVGKTKFYEDCAAGFPALHSDGTLSRYQVMQYGQQQDVATRSLPQFDNSAEREELEIRKLRAEVKEKEMKTRREDALWMHKVDAWAAVAAGYATLKDNIRFQLHEGQGQLVYLAQGKPETAPQVYEAAIDMVDRAFDEMSGSQIDGMFAESIDQESATEDSDNEQ